MSRRGETTLIVNVAHVVEVSEVSTVVSAAPSIALFHAMCARGRVRPAPVASARRRSSARTASMQPLDPRPPRSLTPEIVHAARADHAGEEPRGVRRAARHRLRLRDRRPGALPRQRVRRSQGPRRGVPRHPVEDPDRRAARAVAAHPAAVPAEQGPRARHRPDRIGQVDDALRDDRLHQPHARTITSSRSRIRSSSCTRTRSA